jgi:hypothetical protein
VNKFIATPISPGQRVSPHLSQQTQIHHTRKALIIHQHTTRNPIENIDTVLEPLMRRPQLYRKLDIFITIVEEPMHGVERYRFSVPELQVWSLVAEHNAQSAFDWP